MLISCLKDLTKHSEVYAKCMSNFHLKGEQIAIRYDNLISRFEIDDHVETEAPLSIMNVDTNTTTLAAIQGQTVRIGTDDTVVNLILTIIHYVPMNVVVCIGIKK